MTEDAIRAARAATLRVPEAAAAKLAAAGKLHPRERIALLMDAGLLRRGRPVRERARGRTACRRRRHRPRHGRRPPGARRRQRPDGEGRLVGRADRREDRAGHRGGAARRAARLLVHRLGRRPHHRPGRPVPRSSRRGTHLPQPGRAVGQGAADLLPVRPVGRGRRLHPGLLRRRDHGRGQRVDVPRQPPDGRDGRGGEGDARGDGRRADARDRLRLRRQPRARRPRRDRAGAPRLLLPAGLAGASSRRSTRRSLLPASSRPTWCRCRRASRSTSAW